MEKHEKHANLAQQNGFGPEFFAHDDAAETSKRHSKA
jgi:hypothetical protein